MNDNQPNEVFFINVDISSKILSELESNICKIQIGEKQSTGFFCKMPFPDIEHMLPVLITDSHIINEELLYKKDAIIEIYIHENSQIKQLNLNNRIKYRNEEYDTIIIELKENDDINNFLLLDDNIINDIINNENKNEEYIKEKIYIIHYPNGELSSSFGILDKINEDKIFCFNHKCSTHKGSSGSPLLKFNHKLIGIHTEINGQQKSIDVPNDDIFYNIGIFLNYPMKEFIEIYFKNKNVILEKFNMKYNTNVINTHIMKIDLGFKEIGNEAVKELCNIEFKELKELYLNRNNISDIKTLKNAKFEKLEILQLSNNKISDINILEKTNFKELKILYLNSNNISDIKVLEKVQLEKLLILDLGYNQITDINALEKANFKELKQLNLSRNNISDMKVFEKVNFAKLEKLNLYGNNIININSLEKANFKELKEIDLDGNNISEIKVLEKVNFAKLEILCLAHNKITDINVFDKVNFNELKKLDLSHNKISDIKVLKKDIFKKIEILCLEDNIETNN